MKGDYGKTKYVPMERKSWNDSERLELAKIVKSGCSLSEIRNACGKSSFEIITEMRDISGSELPLQDSDLNEKNFDQSLTMRQVAPSRGMRWTSDEEKQLLEYFLNRKNIKAIANSLQRTAKGCWMHLQDMASADATVMQSLFDTEVFYIRHKKQNRPSFPKYYRHFKGGKYKVLMFGKDSETLEDVVIYQALYGEHGIWVRPRAMFFEDVVKENYSGPRFTEITEEEALS